MQKNFRNIVNQPGNPAVTDAPFRFWKAILVNVCKEILEMNKFIAALVAGFFAAGAFAQAAAPAAAASKPAAKAEAKKEAKPAAKAASK